MNFLQEKGSKLARIKYDVFLIMTAKMNDFVSKVDFNFKIFQPKKRWMNLSLITVSFNLTSLSLRSS